MSESDSSLAIMLLAGFIIEDAKGLPRQTYFEDETKARAALVRLLLDGQPLNPLLRLRMAELFATESDAERRLVFEFRLGRGRRHQHLANTRIATEVLQNLLEAEVLEEKSAQAPPSSLRTVDPEKFATAVGAVADKYGLDDKHVEKQWRRYRRIHERWYRIRGSN